MAPTRPSGALPVHDHQLDLILGAIAVAARSLTEASGSAIAMWRDDMMVCRARSGEMSPPLGARLSAESGISGECLRSGQIQICHNTDNDVRVDAEVCRQLSLRSIVVLPIPGTGRINGILEVFSTEAHTFTEEHVAALQKLAAAAERARASQPRDVPLSTSGDPQDRRDPGTDADSSRARRGMGSSTTQNTGPQSQGLLPASDPMSEMVSVMLGRRWRPFVLVGTCFLGLLLGVAIWLGWHTPDEASGNRAAPAPAHSVDRRDSELVWTTSSSSEANPRPDPARPSPFRLASKVDVLPRTSTPSSKPGVSGAVSLDRIAPAYSVTLVPRSVGASTLPLTEPEVVEPPPVALAATPTSSGLSSVLPSSTALPKLTPVSVSQGVSAGYLVRRVTPVYPPQAMLSRVQGNVVLQALIAEDGRVQDLKATAGSPILVQAAKDAVSRWRYKPYQLDGKPVPISTTITVYFKLP